MIKNNIYITVTVYDLAKPDGSKPDQEYTWDWLNFGHKSQMGKLTTWAVTNNHQVCIEPATQAEIERTFGKQHVSA